MTKYHLTLWTPEAGIPAARYINTTARSWYTGSTVINATGQKPVYRQHGSQCHRPVAGIPDLFSNVYWHRNAQVIEIQTRQQLKNNYFHETQQIFMNEMAALEGQRLFAEFRCGSKLSILSIKRLWVRIPPTVEI